MALRDQIMQIAQSDPQFSKAVDVMEQRIAHMPVVPKDLDKEIQMLEFVLQNPDKYAEVREAAIKDGYIKPEMMPVQFDQVLIISLLVALYGLQDRMKQQGYARGGLKVAGRELAAQGRGGDDMIAHINHREAEVLKRMGGAGTINPNTGLHEYKGGGGILGAILPVALSFIAPGIGTAIGTALGASGTAASALGGALIGAGTSAITGGNPLVGALTGGIMPVASGALFGEQGLSGALGLNSSGGSGGILGNIFGAGSSTPAEVPEGGFGAAPNPSQGWDANAPATVPTPTARPEGLAALANPDATSPATSVVDKLKNSLGLGGSSGSDGMSLGSLAKLAIPAAALLSSQDKPQQTQPTAMSASQQEYFNRPPITWDWNEIQRMANQNGMSVSDFISQNLSKLSAGTFSTPGSYKPPVMVAQGGPLSHLAKGSGSGRDDTINARLSDGEYVMDAETVALLGDGSTDAGAKRLDKMREEIRKQKGKNLAKGKISPDAKSPLAYLKGVA
jgi:hypothetical protein